MRLRQLLARHAVPGIVLSAYYFVRDRARVHPRAMVQLSRYIRFGMRTEIHPYSRVIIREGGRLEMGERCVLQAFARIGVGAADVRIGDHVRVASNTSLLGSDHRYDDRETPVHLQDRRTPGLEIGDDVWIGTNSVVLPGVNIGRGAIIGAGTVLTEDVPEFAVVVGNPGRVIRYRGRETPDGSAG